MVALQWCVAPLILLGACAGSVQGPNTLYRARLEITLTEREAEVVAMERRLWSLEQAIAADGEDAAEAQAESWRAEALLRQRTAELDRQVRTLQAAEEDLAAALTRKTQIDAELASVRELEGQLAQREQRMSELQDRIETLEIELVEKEAAFAERQAAAARRLAELEERSAVLEGLESLVQKAMEEFLALAGPLLGQPPGGKQEQDKAPGDKAPDNR